MKINNIIAPNDRSSVEPTHVYDRDRKKIYTIEMHGHLRAVRRDMAEGRIMIPKVKKI